MNEDEYLELLEFARQHIRDLGRPDLDELAFFSVETRRASDQVDAYLQNVTRLLLFESSDSVDMTLRGINEAIEADGGVNDIILLPQEFVEAGPREAVSLRAALPRRRELVRELEEFRREIRRDDWERER